MKLKEINPDHYIIVDDSEIKEGDYKYHHVKGIVKAICNGAYTNEFKITHSTDIEFNEVYYIPLSEVKELLGEVDVEKIAEHHIGSGYSSYELVKSAFIAGYNQALEDNKDKKYTEEDLKRYHNIMCLHGNKKGEEFIQSLQPKTEWEVEFDENGKLKLV